MSNQIPYRGRNGRRKFLRRSGLLIAGGISATGIASGQERTRTIATNGPPEEIDELLARGRVEEAEQALDEQNTEYSLSSVARSNSSQRSGGYSTQAEYDQCESELVLLIWDDGADIYTVTGYAYLDGTEDTLEYASKARDAFGLVIDHDEWSVVDPDSDASEAIVRFWDCPGDGPDASIENVNPNHGVAASVSFHNEGKIGCHTGIKMQTQLEDESGQGDDPTPLKLRYQHNGAWFSSSASVSIGLGPLGLSVDLDNASELWELDISDSP